MATFSTSTIHEGKDKLTSIAAYNHTVLVGTQDGHVLHLAQPSTPDATASSTTPAPPPRLKQKVLASSDHVVVQICAAAPCGVVLLLLSDGTVMMHELPSLKSLGAVERAVDCASIALLHASDAEGCRLAAAGRKKLVLYRWRAGTAAADTQLFEAEEGCFEPFSEVGLPEPMRWMAWGGESQLWLALKQRYVKLGVPSLEMADVLPYAGGTPVGGGPAGGSKGKDKDKDKNDAPERGPLGAPLVHGEALLLAQETLGVFVDASGKPCRGFSITLAERPVTLSASGALFLCALHRKGVDIHALHAARPPIQRVAHLAGASAIAVATISTASTAASRALRPPPVYILSATSVDRLMPPTLPAHALALAASGALDEALAISEAHVMPTWRALGEHDAVLQHLASLAQAHASHTQPSVMRPPSETLPPSSSQKSSQPKHKRSASDGRAVAPPAAEAPEAPPDAPALIDRATTTLVAYLRGLDTSDADAAAVIRRHAEILLRREPSLAAALLCERLPSGAWLLAPPAARQLLHEAAPDVAVPILEALLADAKEAERPATVAALVDALLAAAVGTAHSGAAAAASGAAAAAAYAGERLLALLHETIGTDDLDRAATLSAIEAASTRDPKPLGRHRLLILGDMGRHAEAMDLLATRLDNVALAHEYCTAHSERAAAAGGAAAGTSSTPSLFVQLLERYLGRYHGVDGGAADLSAANQLLARWPEGTSAVEALRKLPPGLPLSQIEHGLAALLRGTQERQRSAQMRAALLRAVSLQTRAELQAKRGKRLVVTDETECAVCGRRIGSAAFAYVASSGAFMHVGCHGVTNVTPALS